MDIPVVKNYANTPQTQPKYNQREKVAGVHFMYQ